MHLIWNFLFCLPIHSWWNDSRQAFKRSASRSVDTIWITRRDCDIGQQTTLINRVCLKDMYVWGVNSTVTKHSGYLVGKDTSERANRCCDDKASELLCTKIPLLERVQQQKIAKKTWKCSLCHATNDMFSKKTTAHSCAFLKPRFTRF